MQMAWVRQVCGRLNSDYRYTNKLVYNNFPWPQLNVSEYTQTIPCRATGVKEAAARTYWSSYHEDGEDVGAIPKAVNKGKCLTGDARSVTKRGRDPSRSSMTLMISG